MDKEINKNFIERIIDQDLKEGKYTKIATRFPPEPNGYLHVGHAKSILLNYGLAQKYNGSFNLRFDDTNPTKEKTEFVESIVADVEWLGAHYDGEIKFASHYFQDMYEAAIKLIKKGKAYVCDLSAEEIRSYRGTLTEPGKNSPYRERSIEENLDLFERMKNGEFEDGSKVLRAKIDMSSPNINMRDPVIYRVARMTHHNTGDTWCIYPMYDFAHPIEDAIEEITHSICTLEFEDHRPLYDWVVQELEYEHPPKQIEFAKLYLTNVITGKRYIKRLVDQGIVDGWDDPRLVTIAALRRRGFTPESLKNFMELVGVAKSNSSVDYAMLEYCIRNDLKPKAPRVMAVLDPIKLVIDNYPEDQVEYLDAQVNMENPELGVKKVPFGKELLTLDDLIQEFDVKRISKSGAIFDINKLKWMNSQYLKNKSTEELVQLCQPFLEKAYDLSSKDQKWIENLIVVHKDHISYGEEIIEQVQLFFEDEIHPDEEAQEFMQDEAIPNTLKVFKAHLEQLSDEEFTEQNIFACIKATQKEAKAKGKMLYMPIRIATTGIMHGPDLASSIMLLGKEKVLSRL